MDTLNPLGEPCEQDSDCESGLCETPKGGEKICLPKCTGGCDETEVCTLLAPERYGCVPERAGLCEQCASDEDCPYAGDRCVTLGAERFCGRDCSFDDSCPESFRCADALLADGSPAGRQCLPISGTCECIQDTLGQTIPCEQTNSFGTCMGSQVCESNGWSVCSSLIPAAEACNGIDDDCNGEVDETFAMETCGVGACARTVTACVDGGSVACVPGEPTAESCNTLDDDCDNEVDEDFDLDNDPLRCGACDNVCAAPNAVPACTQGNCVIGMCSPGYADCDGLFATGCEVTPASDVQHCGACNNRCQFANAVPECAVGDCRIQQCLPNFWDLDGLESNGCEYACTIAGAETCNGADDDCDGQIDEGFDLDNDVNRCGACNNVCSAPNAIPVCTDGDCDIGTCSAGYANCDGLFATGCEVNLTNSVLHCGACNNACSFPNAVPACVAGGCQLQQCQPNYWNLDGNDANGCEYACTFSSPVDLPDLNFVDANCDGIDGEVANAVFVAPPVSGGNDLNPGTRALPKATLAAALSEADASMKRDVYVASGTYGEQLSITSSRGVYGGYEAMGWTRHGSFVTSVINVNQPLRIVSADGTTVQLINFVGASATASGSSAFAAVIRLSSDVVLERISLQAGNGANGSDGTNGSTGAIGNPGSNGEAGREDSGGTCQSTSRPVGGPGGTSSCGRTGGRGGLPGHEQAWGTDGGTGVGGTAGGNGVPNDYCQGDTCSGGFNLPASFNAHGKNGLDGGVGSDGTPGAGFGTLTSTGYTVATSSDGATGSHGNGGGGGGGGGGGDDWCDSWGSGGGGGGAGGDGGRGANGGAGGVGGISPYGTNDSQSDGSPGGKGGKGGNGGRGGHGGAGGGGPSIAVATHGTSTFTRTGTTSLGVGNPGLGGSSLGGGASDGVVRQTYP